MRVASGNMMMDPLRHRHRRRHQRHHHYCHREGSQSPAPPTAPPNSGHCVTGVACRRSTSPPPPHAPPRSAAALSVNYLSCRLQRLNKQTNKNMSVYIKTKQKNAIPLYVLRPLYGLFSRGAGCFINMCCLPGV